MHENDRRKKLITIGDFGNKTPTHIGANHAITKSEQNFQIRIPSWSRMDMSSTS